ncbi:MAG: PrcB C-terminal [Symbiobacteriaceae bacterium]|nr:PrcB C-terminal [Symbiobacteriaceae bacterium]
MNLMLATSANDLAPLPGSVMRPAVTVPQVDWASEAALVIDMGEQRTAGYSLTVTDVARTQAGVVELKLQVRRPGRGDFVAQVITHPYTVAKVPRAWLNGATVVAVDQHGTELIRQVVSL